MYAYESFLRSRMFSVSIGYSISVISTILLKILTSILNMTQTEIIFLFYEYSLVVGAILNIRMKALGPYSTV